MQSTNSSREGQRFQPIHVLTGPMSGTVQVQPIRASSVNPFGHFYDDFLFDDHLFDDLPGGPFDDIDHFLDHYLPLPAPAHGSGSSRRSRAATTSEEAILSRLPEVTGRSRSGEECAVCLHDFGADETLRAMPSCSHAFHQRCIVEWLRRNATCPLCRRRLPEVEEDREVKGSASLHLTAS